jgi:hypothetical protein
MLYFSILLHCIDLTFGALVPSTTVCATSFTVPSSHSFIGHYMFRPNWPSLSVQEAYTQSLITYATLGGHAVAQLVQGLFYKPEGRSFDYR